MTEGKRHMIESNASPMDQILEHVTQNAKGDLVTNKSLSTLVRRAVIDLHLQDIFSGPQNDKVTRYVWKKIGNLRGEKNGAIYLIDTKQIEIRALRNKSKWKFEDKLGNRESITKEAKKNSNGTNIFQIG